MKFDRTKNASRNAVYGVILKVYQIMIPFFMRTAVIYFMGIQYLGLSSLFSSILQVLNLAELGVSSAMVFSMYKPIAEDNTEKVCALMNMYRTYYRIIGLVIAVAGGVLTPFVPHLIKGNLPADVNVFYLYFLELSTTVVSYWLFAYRNCLLYAHQREDICSKINICVNTLLYISQILVLVFVRIYYVYVIVSLLATILRNVVTGYVSKRVYPQYSPKGKLPKAETASINRRIRDLFTSKLGFVIVGSADTIVISAFLGLETLAIYQNYYFIMSSIMGILTAVYSACTAGIGNSLLVESKEKNFRDLKKITFIFGWIACFCSVSFLCVYQPFMKLWMGEDRMLPFSVIVCLALYFFIYEINQLLNLFKDAGGLWSKDKFRPLVTALGNLGMNLIMVQFWGLYGVILSTVLSACFIGMPWLFYNLFTELFDKKMMPSLLKEIFCFVVALIISGGVSLFLSVSIKSGDFMTLIIRLIICLCVPNIVMLVMFKDTEEFRAALRLVNKITKGKFSFVKKVKGKLAND